MPGSGPRESILFALCVALCVVGQVALVWRSLPARPKRKRAAGPVQSVPLLNALCAFLSIVGLALLLPWATALPTLGSRALWPAMLLLVLFVTGMLYALARRPDPTLRKRKGHTHAHRRGDYG